MTTLGRYILWHGRTVPVVALMRSNNVECVAIMDAGKPVLIPEATCQPAPKRTRPQLVWSRP